MQTNATQFQQPVITSPIGCEPLLYAKREAARVPNAAEQSSHSVVGTKTLTEVSKENVDAD